MMVCHQKDFLNPTYLNYLQKSDSINKLRMGNINKTHMPGFTPTRVTSLRAILRCRPHFSIEVARQITPSRSKWKSLKYIVATCVWR